MTDNHTSKQRSFNMSQVRGKDTKPEKLVRSLLHKNGYRFRLHVKDLPGRPDIVLPKHRKIIEVRGCFWHMHDCKKGQQTPKTNCEFWENKRNATVKRDAENLRLLESDGWNVLVVWECMCEYVEALESTLIEFMELNLSNNK